MAGKTGKQYDEIIKELKEQIRLLKANQKDAEIGDLPQRDSMVYKTKTGEFVRIDTEFDPENKLIKIVSEQNLGKDIDIATYRLMERLSLRIAKL